MSWMRDETEKPNILGKNENLCWSCARAIAGCSWSREFVPVDGWDAEPDGETYKIRNCPLFVRMVTQVDFGAKAARKHRR